VVNTKARAHVVLESRNSSKTPQQSTPSMWTESFETKSKPESLKVYFTFPFKLCIHMTCIWKKYGTWSSSIVIWYPFGRASLPWSLTKIYLWARGPFESKVKLKMNHLYHSFASRFAKEPGNSGRLSKRGWIEDRKKRNLKLCCPTRSHHKYLL